MNCTPEALAEAAKCYRLPKDRTRAVWISLLCQWAGGAGCTWYQGALGDVVSDLVPYPSFDEALAACAGVTNPSMVWFSAYPDISNVVGIGQVPGPEWTLGIVANGSTVFTNTYPTATDAVNAVAGSGFMPAGFCTE